MARWYFWNEKRFSGVYENIYIRAVREDWFNIIFKMANEVNSMKTQRKMILDIGCGEGHTTKQVLDRVEGSYACDLLEPDKRALASAMTFLKLENNIGVCYPETLADFRTTKKYDVIFTSHTNYYWALDKKGFDSQLGKLLSMLKSDGKLIILTLPEESDHYNIMLKQIYPKFNYAQYIINFYKKLGLKVRFTKLRMRFFVGDILSTEKTFDLKSFYQFIHNTKHHPNEMECREFRGNIEKYHKSGYLDFKDYLIVVEPH